MWHKPKVPLGEGNMAEELMRSNWGQIVFISNWCNRTQPTLGTRMPQCGCKGEGTTFGHHLSSSTISLTVSSVLHTPVWLAHDLLGVSSFSLYYLTGERLGLQVCATTSGSCIWVWGIKLRSSDLHGKCHASWTISHLISYDLMWSLCLASFLKIYKLAEYLLFYS